ncbi:MAG TPA: hypothetical protein VJ957_10640 [Longimicrobiales bacterium]|nr:hypothetical protein [Longimicrobiales bacterium]
MASRSRVVATVKLVPLHVPGSNKKQPRVLVVPDPLVAGAGQVIHWVGEGAFAVHFHGETPVLGRLEVRSVPPAKSRARHVAEAVVRGDAVRPRTYRYSVSLYDPETDSVHTADPEVIVEPDPPTQTEDNPTYMQ